MKNWIEIENRLRPTITALTDARLDIQEGAAGEYYRIAAYQSNLKVREFKNIICIASKSLEKALPQNAEILKEKNLEIRWYKLLKGDGNFLEYGPTGEQKNSDGSSAGFIYCSTIHNIAEVSANKCLDLQSTYPIKRTILEILYEDFGKQLIIGILIAIASSLITYFFTTK